MVKYLPGFGHEVLVLASSYNETDLLNNKPVLRVHQPTRLGPNKIDWLLHRLSREIRKRIGSYFSYEEDWKRNVEAISDEIANVANPDIVLATYPFIENLELGLFFSEKYQLPLISDFRDGLLFEPIEPVSKQNPAVTLNYRKVEERVARQSLLTITVSEPISEYFRQTYGATNVYTIPNGFDPDDFDSLPEVREIDREKFNIVYTGRLGLSDTTRSARTFFSVIEELISRQATLVDTLRVNMVGEYTEAEMRAGKELTMKNVLVFHGLKDRKISLAFQRAADVLLLVTTMNKRSEATGKVFEYLCAGQPILALSHNTAAGEIVKRTGAGWVINPEDKSQIYEIVLRMLTDITFCNSINPKLEEINTYSRKRQMRHLSNLINDKFPGKR